jgi:hypothetical protein
MAVVSERCPGRSWAAAAENGAVPPRSESVVGHAALDALEATLVFRLPLFRLPELLLRTQAALGVLTHPFWISLASEDAA